MDALLQRLDQIEAKLDRVINGPQPDVVGVAGAMPLTGCKTKRAQAAWFRRYNVKPYARGKYRRIDITNKIARIALGLDFPVQKQRINPSTTCQTSTN